MSDLQQNSDPITSEELVPPEEKIVISPLEIASVAPDSVTVTATPDVAAPDQVSPPRDPAWTGWDVLAILMVGAVSFVTLLFLLVLFFPGHSLQDKANRVASRPDLALGLQVVVYLIVLACMYVVVMARTGGASFLKSIHWNWPAVLWPYLLTGLALQAVVVTMEQFLPLPKDTPFDALLKNPRTVLLIAAFAVTLGPLMEELFFRAFLYPVLARGFGRFAKFAITVMGFAGEHTSHLARRAGVIAAIAITALGFAGVHASQYANSPTLISLLFMVGLVIGWVRAKKNSVAAGLLVHMAYNGVVVLALIAAKIAGKS